MLACGLIVLLLPRDAMAYVDPNAAGLLFQFLFPVIAAIAGWWALFRDKTAALWNRLWKRPTPKTPTDDQG